MLTGPILSLLGLALSLGVPLLIAMRAPQRWRMGGFLAWLFLPLILAVVFVTIQAVQDPQSPGDLGKLLFGLAIIGSVLAIPWILACVIGYAIGKVLRPKSLDPAPPAPAVAAAAIQPPAALESVSPPESPPNSVPASTPAPPHGVEVIDPYLSRHTAPDDSIFVELSAVEWSNTHWVESPKVVECASGRVLLDLWGTDWDAAVSFPAPRAVALSFRRYHHGGALDAEIHLGGAGFDDATYVIRERSGSISRGPLAEMPAALEAASDRAAAAARAAMAQAGSSTPPARHGQFRMALLILAGAILAIAAATYVTVKLSPPPVQHLDTVPPMPNGLPDSRPRF